MAIDLITGHQGVAHISAEQIANINNALMDDYGVDKVVRLDDGTLIQDGLTINVGTGFWRVNGFDMEIQEAETVYIDPTATGLSRIDNIYVEILQDIPTGSQRSEIVTVQGEAAASPVAPDAPTAPVLNTDILLQVTPLATVTVTEGAMVMTDLSVAYEMVTPSELEAVETAVTDIVNVYGAKNLIPYPYYDTSHSRNGITWTDNGDGSVTINGTASVRIYVDLARNSTFLKPGRYILSGGITSKQYIYVNATNNGSYVKTIVSSFTEEREFTIDYNGYNAVTVGLSINAGETLSNVTFYPMIRSASITDPTYAPPAKTNQQLTQDTTALLDNTEVNGAVNMLPNNFTTQTINGITWTVNDDGSVTANGTATGIYAAITFIINAKIPQLKNGETYKISGCPSGGSSENYELYVVDATTSTYVASDYGNGATFTYNSSHNYNVGCVVRNGKTASNLTFKPMITVASYNGDYVPYAKSNKELTDAFTNQISDNDDAYSPSKAYKVGEHCIYNNVLYKCVTACSAAAWSVNQNCFEATTLTSAVTDLNNDLGEKANTEDFLATKVFSFYSGDGISGYASKDFSLSITRPTGYKAIALKEIVTNSGNFIFSVRNIGDTTLQVRAFNCTANVANPGTITYCLLFAKEFKAL